MIHRIIKTIIATPASEPNEPHRAIARLPAAGSPVRIVTTNYDLHLSSALPRRYATPRPRSNVFVRRRPTRYDKLMPNTRALVAQHQMTLMPAGDETKWLAHGEPIGLSAFETKAFYVIGALREMVESAGLSLKRDYFLAALFMSLDAVELIGRCIRGPRIAKPIARLENGLLYLFPNAPTLAADYIRLRDFIGHGAAASGLPLRFSEQTSIDLMEGLSAALDSIWTDSGRMVAFADAQIDPLMTRSNLGVPEIIYVRDVKKHLDQGLRPSEVMKWEDWRQRPRFREILISNRTPSPTGF